jgi:hypothetical protein
MLCVKNVSLTMAEMVKLPFPMYGGLYFADAPIEQSLKSGFVEGSVSGHIAAHSIETVMLEILDLIIRSLPTQGL